MLLKTLKYTILRFFKEGFQVRAAALSFTTLLSLVPLIAVGFTILSLFPIFQKLALHIQQFIFSNFVPAAGDTVSTYVQNFVNQAAKLSILGVSFLTITVIILLLGVERAFNLIWQVPKGRRSYIAILTYLSIIIFTPILIGGSIIISSYLASIPILYGPAVSLGLVGLILKFLPIILSAIVFSLLYLLVPNCKVPWWSAITAGLTAAIIFELTKWGFSIYVTHIANYKKLYGAFAAIPIFFIWVYVSWVLVLFFGLFSKSLVVNKKIRKT